jgi:hypothetical protein
MKKTLCVLAVLALTAALRADYVITIGAITSDKTIRLDFTANDNVQYRIVNGDDPVLFVNLTTGYNPIYDYNFGNSVTTEEYAGGLSYTVDGNGLTITGCPEGEQYKIAVTEGIYSSGFGAWDPEAAQGYVGYQGYNWYGDPFDPESWFWYSTYVSAYVTVW